MRSNAPTCVCDFQKFSWVIPQTPTKKEGLLGGENGGKRRGKRREKGKKGRRRGKRRGEELPP
jgi:hypothetical protein